MSAERKLPWWLSPGADDAPEAEPDLAELGTAFGLDASLARPAAGKAAKRSKPAPSPDGHDDDLPAD
jgi:hypothetical protein